MEKDILIEELNCSARTKRILSRLGVIRIQDISKITREDILQIKNIGEYGLQELEQELAQNGIGLTIDPDSITNLDLEEKTIQALIRGNIRKISQLTKLSKGEILKIEGIGAKRIKQIIEALEKEGIELTETKKWLYEVTSELEEKEMKQEAKKEIQEKIKQIKPYEEDGKSETLIEELGVNAKILIKLKKANIQTIEQLENLTEAKAREITGIGEIALKEIKEQLQKRGKSLKPSPWVKIRETEIEKLKREKQKLIEQEARIKEKTEEARKLIAQYTKPQKTK